MNDPYPDIDFFVEENWLGLCDLVHEVANNIAAEVNNSGQPIDYLLSNGLDMGDIREYLTGSRDSGTSGPQA